jgi:hypothetical protein
MQQLRLLQEFLDRLNVIAPEHGFLRQYFGRINIVPFLT